MILTIYPYTLYIMKFKDNEDVFFFLSSCAFSGALSTRPHTGTIAQQHSAVLAEYARISWPCFLHVRRGRTYLREPIICRLCGSYIYICTTTNKHIVWVLLYAVPIT